MSTYYSFVLFCFQNQNSNAKINGSINSQNYKEKLQRKEELYFSKQQNEAYMTNLFAATQQKRTVDMDNHHEVLARTVSTPMADSNQTAVNNLFTSLNDILNATGAVHRKLERTQSEPIPQTTSSSHTSR